MEFKVKNMGFQSPKGWRQTKCFSCIELRGDFAYCASHNFIYHPDEQEKLLYDAKPCYYTDNRYWDSEILNSYRSAKLWWNRRSFRSLKACIRTIKQCRNIPKGTVVEIDTERYLKGYDFRTGYLYKVKKENKLRIQYKIDMPRYFRNFDNCEFSQKLTQALRQAGFIVGVMGNSNHLLNMLNSVGRLVGQGNVVNSMEDGQIAIAYGHGKKIGFSAGSNNLYGYGQGIENILWERYGEFDKWSYCQQIPKTKSIEKIVEILTAKTEVITE